MAEVAEKPVLPMEEEKRVKFFKYHYKGLLLVLLPIVFCPILFSAHILPYRYLYMVILVYLFFLLNVMPVGATAFIICVSMPLLGIEASKLLCVSYYGDIIFQFFAVLMLGVMMDISKMSTWLAYFLLGLVGSNLRLIHIMLLVITTLLSLFWPTLLVSAVMMRIAIAMLTELNTQGVYNMNSEEEPYEYNSNPYPSWMTIGIYLTIAYSAIIGAFCSPLNSPNYVLFELFKVYMPDSEKSIKFSSTLLLMGPVMLFELIILFLWFQIIFFGLFRPSSNARTAMNTAKEANDDVKETVRTKKAELGGCTTHLVFASICMTFAFLLCLFRKPIGFDGIADIINKKVVEPSCFLILICVAAFMIPANCLFIRYCTCFEPSKVGAAPSLVGWKLVNSMICWGHVYYLACGIAVVHCGVKSGFYQLICDSIVRAYINNASLGKLEFYASFFAIFTTMLSPAVSLARAATPMVFSLGHKLNVGGGRLAVPFSMALHPSFMFPSASGPGAIVAGWGNIRTWQMFLIGIIPTIFGFAFIYLFYSVLAKTAFPGYTDMQDSLNLTALDPTTTKKKFKFE